MIVNKENNADMLGEEEEEEQKAVEMADMTQLAPDDDKKAQVAEE